MGGRALMRNENQVILSWAFRNAQMEFTHWTEEAAWEKTHREEHGSSLKQPVFSHGAKRLRGWRAAPENTALWNSSLTLSSIVIQAIPIFLYGSVSLLIEWDWDYLHYRAIMHIKSSTQMATSKNRPWLQQQNIITQTWGGCIFKASNRRL